MKSLVRRIPTCQSRTLQARQASAETVNPMYCRVMYLLVQGFPCATEHFDPAYYIDEANQSYIGGLGEGEGETRLDALGFTRTHCDSLGFTSTHLDSLGFTWTHLDSLWLTWTRLDSLGLTWIHLDSLELTWTHLDSLELT